MALPKISHPIYETTLPDSNKKIKYRGFLAVEEKLLLLAVQSNEPSQMVLALKQIISNCVIDNINVDKLIMPSVEWLYLQIIQKSIGEELDLSISCSSCSEEISYKLQLNNIPAPKIVKKANIIKIDADTFLTLKYPTLDSLEDLDVINEVNGSQSSEDIVKALANNIECLTVGDDTYSFIDQTDEEILEWFADLSGKQMGKITNFFKTIPTIEEIIEFDCPCGHHNLYSIKGISELFL